MGNLKNFLARTIYKLRQIPGLRSVYNYSSGQPVNPETAMKVAALYRGLTYIATQIANLPWEVKDSKNNVLGNDAIAYLLNVSPNPEMNAHSFRIAMLLNAIMHGNFIAEIERNYYGKPIALWPIAQHDIFPWRDAEGTLFYRVVGGSKTNIGADAYIHPSNVFHIKNINSFDGMIGQGIIHYATTTLGISLGADSMAGNLFSNMGMPSGIISVQGALSDVAGARIKESWNTAHNGKKSGGTAVLEQGATFTPINVSPNVLQFLESRKFGVVEIARFLGLPPAKLFDAEASKFNNIEQANLEVATDTLNTWTRVIESEADMKLLNGQFAGKYTQLDLYHVFRGDMKTRGQYFKDMISIGSITPNEVRNKEGLAPYKDGDKFYISVNNLTPANMVDEVVKSQIKSANTPAPSPAPADPSKAEIAKATVKFLESRTKT